MSDFKVIIPESTTNLIDNPQIYDLSWTPSNWVVNSDGIPAFTRDSTYVFIGSHAARFGFGIGATWVEMYQAFTTTATAYTLTAMIRRAAGGALTDAHVRAVFDNNVVAWQSMTEWRPGWYFCVYTGTSASGAGRQFGVRAYEADLRADAVTLENKDHHTSYVDGTRPGCRWVGQAHASQSFRLETERSGGLELDIEDDLGLRVLDFVGLGMPSVTVLQRDKPLLRGSSYAGTRSNATNALLTLLADGGDVPGLHALRQAFIDVIKPDAGEGNQQFTIIYTGAAIRKQAKFSYEAGMEIGPWEAFIEKLPLRIVRTDPAWHDMGDTGAELDDQDSATMRLLLGRENRDWTVFGPPLALTATYTALRAIESTRLSHSRLFLGGSFLNYDDIAQADNIAAYNWQTAAFEALGTGCNGPVFTIAKAQGDLLYVGGQFLAAGGVANTNYMALWDIGASAWSSLGNANNIVYSMCYASDGNLYAAGAFTLLILVGANRIGYWDGAAWNALGAPGLNNTAYVVKQGPDGNLYVGGTFTQAGGAAGFNRIAMWDFDTGAWVALGIGLNGACWDICWDDAGNLYAVGTFTTAGGAGAANGVAMWTGAEWLDLDEGAPGATGIYTCDWINGELYVGGQGMTTIGNITLTSQAAKWSGKAWSHIDFDPVTYVYRIRHDVYNNVYYGTNLSGTVRYAGDVVVDNIGTEAEKPMIWLGTHVGTIPRLIRNTRTGKEIRLNMTSVVDTAEIITIDLRDPERPLVASSARGDLINNVIPGSVLTTFELLPGENNIEVYSYAAGATGTEVYLVLPPIYWSVD